MDVSGSTLGNDHAVAESAVSAEGAMPEFADVSELLRALRRSQLELETVRRQFDAVVDPLLVDQIVFRLGAAERQFNYLFHVARRLNVRVDGMRWEWLEDCD